MPKPTRAASAKVRFLGRRAVGNGDDYGDLRWRVGERDGSSEDPRGSCRRWSRECRRESGHDSSDWRFDDDFCKRAGRQRQPARDGAGEFRLDRRHAHGSPGDHGCERHRSNDAHDVDVGNGDGKRRRAGIDGHASRDWWWRHGGGDDADDADDADIWSGVGVGDGQHQRGADIDYHASDDASERGASSVIHVCRNGAATNGSAIKDLTSTGAT